MATSPPEMQVRSFVGEGFGDKIYDVGSRLGGRVFHSMDDLVGAINE